MTEKNIIIQKVGHNTVEQHHIETVRQRLVGSNWQDATEPLLSYFDGENEEITAHDWYMAMAGLNGQVALAVNDTYKSTDPSHFIYWAPGTPNLNQVTEHFHKKAGIMNIRDILDNDNVDAIPVPLEVVEEFIENTLSPEARKHIDKI